MDAHKEAVVIVSAMLDRASSGAETVAAIARLVNAAVEAEREAILKHANAVADEAGQRRIECATDAAERFYAGRHFAATQVADYVRARSKVNP